MAQKRKHWDLNPGCSTSEVLLKGGVQFQGSVWLCPKPQVLPPSIPLLIKEGGKKGENDSLCSQVRGPAGSSSWKVGQGQEELSAVEAAPTKGPACRCTACSPQPLSSITCLFPLLLQRSGALTAPFLTTPSFFPPRQDLRMLLLPSHKHSSFKSRLLVIFIFCFYYIFSQGIYHFDEQSLFVIIITCFTRSIAHPFPFSSSCPPWNYFSDINVICLQDFFNCIPNWGFLLAFSWWLWSLNWHSICHICDRWRVNVNQQKINKVRTMGNKKWTKDWMGS